jgi:3-oxoadipate enol-lactonase
MAFAKVRGTQLYYLDQGAGQPVLLVHGFPLDHSMWAEQLPALSANYRLIIPDLRGFGRSEVTEGTVTMEQYADDLAALLDELAIRDPLVFCGLSMGGYIAWQFWKRHAARLRSLILCDTRAAADTSDAARGRLETAEKVLTQGPQVVVDAMLGKVFAEETIRSQPAIVDRIRQVMQSTSPAGIAAALRGMAKRPDMTNELSSIQVPALVVCGEHDAITKLAEMREISQALPRARFVEVPRAGHMSPLEQPQIVNSAVLDFLKAN